MNSKQLHTCDYALNKLIDGNKRFAEGKPLHPNRSAEYRSDQAKHGQTPLAAVLACSDSRVPVEIIFDQGVGDLFVILAAGQVAGPDQIGSIEYGVEHLGVPLVIVLGHTQCGAIIAALAGSEEPGDLGRLLSRLKPVAEAVVDIEEDGRLTAALGQAVDITLAQLRQRSELLSKAEKDGGLKIIGGIYDLESGLVEFRENPR